jgi:hypothetical protein
MYTYNPETGEREEAFSSSSSSHNASRSWVPPPQDDNFWVNEDRGLGRHRVRKDVTFAPNVASTPGSPEVRQTQSAPTTPYTPYLAFKAPHQLFGAQLRHDSPPPKVKPVAAGETNFLYGIAQPRMSTHRPSVSSQPRQASATHTFS